MSRKRVIAYLRVSTDLQDTDRQLKQIQEYCSVNDYDLLETIEDKVSGAISNRTGLNKLMTKTNKDADLIIISEQSRFSREDDLISVLENIRLVLNNGLDLLFLDKPDTIYKAKTKLNIIDLLTIIIKANMSSEEKSQIKERMKTGKLAKLKSDPYAFVYCNVPFGYNKIPNPKYKPNAANHTAKYLMEINEKEAAIIREIYRLYTENGYTGKDIALYLKSKGYNMSIDSIYTILKRKDYVGERYYKGDTLINLIEPIIDREVFDKASLVIENNRRNRDNNVSVNPLKGFIKCSCGSSMRMTASRYYKLEQCYKLHKYACQDRYLKKSNCKSVGMAIDVVLHIVSYSIMNITKKADYNNETQKQISIYENRIKESSKAIEESNSMISSINKQIENVVDSIALEDNKVIRNAFTAKLEALSNSIEEHNKLIKHHNNNIKRYKNIITDLKTDRSNIQKPSLIELKFLVNQLIERVNYYSFSASKIFIEVKYKNGIEVVYMVRKSPGAYLILELPQDFKFNPETLSVEVSQIKADSNTYTTESSSAMHSFDDILSKYDYEDWIIEKEYKINYELID